MQRINVSVFDTFFDIFAFKKHQGEGMNRDKFFINFNMIRIIPDKKCFTDCDSASKDSYCDIIFCRPRVLTVFHQKLALCR